MLIKTIYRLGFSLCILSNVLAQVNITQWQRTNGPYGGNINEILETDEGDLIAGTYIGGLYRSRNKGQSWDLIPESAGAPLLFRSVWDLVKNSRGHIFAATNVGIYRSTDGGNTWTRYSTSGDTRFVEGIAINSIDVLFAATRGGVIRSDDNGESWDVFNNGLTETSATAIAVNSLGDVFVGTTNGIFFSDDNGDNWSERSAGITSSKYITKIFITPEDSLLAGSYSGVFRSDDYGLNWNKVLVAGTPLSFAQNSDSVFIYGSAGSFVYRSTDNGITWDAASGLLNLAGFHDLLFLGSSDLFAATSRYGVIHSPDYGDTWSEMNSGITVHDILCMATTPSGEIFVGTGLGPMSTPDGGNTWISKTTPEFLSNTYYMAINDAGRIIANIGRWIAISDDNGDTWYRADSSLSTDRPEAITFGNGTDVFVGAEGQVFKSVDNGDTWTEFSTGLPNTEIQALAVHNNGAVFAGTFRGGAFRSTDAGSTWVDVSTGLPDNFEVSAFVIEPNGDVLLSGFGGVYRSTDGGDTWDETGNTPFSDIKSFIRSPNGNLYIAGRGSGVAVSEDSAKTWTRINDGLQHLDAQSLLLDNSGNLYVGTRGGGVFKTRFIPTSVAQAQRQLPDNFILEQNYPNPFNPSTVIQYRVPFGGNVRLIIYNTLGQRVRTLVNEYRSAGKYRVTWSGADQTGIRVPGGVYFYRLEANQIDQTKKLILLR